MDARVVSVGWREVARFRVDRGGLICRAQSQAAAAK